MSNTKLIVSLLFVGTVFAQNDTPLGDVARRKPATAKAKRVVTNEDIPSRPGTEPSAMNATDGTQPSRSNTAAGENVKEQRAAQFEKKQADANAPAGLQDRLTEIKKSEAALERLLAHISKNLEADESEARREMYAEALKRETANLAELKKQRAELESALSQMPAEQKSSSETPAN